MDATIEAVLKSLVRNGQLYVKTVLANGGSALAQAISAYEEPRGLVIVVNEGEANYRPFAPEVPQPRPRK
jgi:hypothetical protein